MSGTGALQCPLKRRMRSFFFVSFGEFSGVLYDKRVRGGTKRGRAESRASEQDEMRPWKEDRKTKVFNIL